MRKKAHLRRFIFVITMILLFLLDLSTNSVLAEGVILQEIRSILSDLPEIKGDTRPDIPPEVRERILAMQPDSGDALLAIIADPKDNLNRKATNAFIKTWESITPVQIDTYFKVALTAYTKLRPQYPRGIEAYIGTGYTVRYGWGGWPNVKGIKMRTTSYKILDGQPYGKPYHYEGHQASVVGILLGGLDLGTHSAQVITEYEITYMENTYSGTVESEIATFEIIGDDTSNSLAAPNDPKLDELVQRAFRFIDIRLRTPDARGHFYWQDDPWEPQNSARRGDNDDEYATHMPLYQVLEPLPVDLCFNVEFHLEETDEVYEGWSLVVPKGQQVHGRYFSVENMPHFVEGKNGFIPLRIVLTPSQEVALNDTRVTQYYNGTLTSGLLRAKAYWFPLSSAKTWERELKTMFQKLENKKHINKQVLSSIKAVSSLNPYRRSHGALSLGQMPGKDTTPAISFLIKLLSGTDTSLEIQAANRAEDALVAIGTPTVEPLIDAIKDENPDVREAAAYLLGSIADRRAVKPLIKALGDSENEVRQTAAFALGEIKDPRAIEPLTAALNDYDNLVRDNAATTLKLINYELKLKENYEAVVHFPDPNLERKIRAAIGKPTGQIKGADLVGVGFTELKASAFQIKGLTGLEYCTDLTILWLSNNQIQDINSLSDLVKLVNLRLDGNQIRDISALTELTKLDRLNLSKNQIVDISPLTGCNNLTNIWIMGNQVTDLAPLSGLSSLEALDIDKNQLRDVSPLAELKNLTVLHAAGNQIADISPLSRLTKMTYLYLSWNQIADISPLQQIANLRILELKHNQISDLSPLSKLPKLNSLEVSNNPIENIEAIESLRNLQHLRIGSCHIGDIDSFSDLTKLKDLILTKNPISDISSLSSLKNLTYLWLDHCQISDIDALGGLTNLKGLHLGYNEINDISVLSELTSLEHIWLEKNLIIDIRPLVENKGISKGTSINLGDNPLSDESVKIHIPALQARGVKVFRGPLVIH